MSVGGVDVLTGHNDVARTGQDLAETTLTPANVNPSTFGRLATDAVDGAVYAQPLVKTGVTIPGNGVHDIVYVATEHDSVYAFDADVPGAPLWHDSFINPAAGITTVPALTAGEADLFPEVGITGTPVIDPATSTLYVVAKTQETFAGVTRQVYRIHALDLATGLEKDGGPAVIEASVAGRGTGRDRKGRVGFQAEFEIQRPGLLLQGGVVYTAFGSLGDLGPYHGWVIGLDATTLKPAVVYNATTNGAEAGIWQSGGGLAADSAGAIYLGTGNGTFNPAAHNYGDSFLKLVRAGSTLKVVGSYTPANQATLAAKDLDYGSGGVLVVETPGRPQALTGGKDGILDLVDTQPTRKARANHLAQTIPGAGHPLFGTPAYFNGTVYVNAVGDVLRSYRLVNGSLVLSGGSAKSFGYPGATPSISASGLTNGIVWEIENSGTRGTSGPAVLHAFDATNVAHELYNSAQIPTRDTAGPAVKFAVPTIADGKVYVGTRTGIAVYGLLPR